MEGSCHCGAVHWRFDGVPADATACSCTICRRYGVLWAYDYEDERIHVFGPSVAYARRDAPDGAEPDIDFNFCPTCGCVAFWRGRKLDDRGRRRIAVNLRLAEPDEVAAIPVDHFDGLTTWKDLPRDGRCVRDMWF